jgi:hypothetical protein
MDLGRYSITSPTIALFKEDKRQVAGLVPKGSIIEIATETTDDTKLISVVWDGQEVLMFVQDLHSRAVPVERGEQDQTNRRAFEMSRAEQN